jgi:hypothetical protein
VIKYIREFFSQPDANWEADQKFIKHIREKYMSSVEEANGSSS